MNDTQQALELDMAMATHVGQVRQRNEDEVLILPAADAAILADGMGGHQAGDVAARLAINIISEEIAKQRSLDLAALDRWIQAANEAIRSVAGTQSAYQGMGATVVVAVRHGAALLFGHVGDSRLYRLGDGELRQLTEDHTLVQQYINEGMISSTEGRTWVGRNLLTRALGIEDTIVPNCAETPLGAGQTYLLCSDGLTEPLDDEQITEVLSDPAYSTQAAADELVARANANGGPDNISVALIRVRDRA